MALTDITRPTDVSMNTDLYELTMAQGLWESGKVEEQGCFTASVSYTHLTLPTNREV